MENASSLSYTDIAQFCREQTKLYRRKKPPLPIVKRHFITISPIVVAPAIATLFIGSPTFNGTSHLTLSFDHRVMNGAYASRALRSIAAQCFVSPTH